jgi:hypothetical protein
LTLHQLISREQENAELVEETAQIVLLVWLGGRVGGLT